MDYEYSKDVLGFLNQCSRVVGTHAEESFSQGVWCEYADRKIESPIEQLFYTSLLTLLELGAIPRNDADILNGEPAVIGLQIKPQFTIERYRVDFYLAWHGYIHRPELPRHVVVECDSQEWHERSEKERRYEKKRDRDLIRLGYHVFRFTGKEIKDEPFRVALETLNYVTGSDHSDLVSYLNDLQETH